MRSNPSCKHSCHPESTAVDESPAFLFRSHHLNNCPPDAEWNEAEGPAFQWVDLQMNCHPERSRVERGAVEGSAVAFHPS